MPARERSRAYILKSENDLFVVAYGVDAGAGGLTEVGRVKLFGYPGRLAVDPNERFVYVTAEADAGPISLSVLRITPSGALEPVPSSPFAADDTLFALQPRGRFLYIGGAAGTIQAHAVDPSTGQLTPVPGFPLAVPGAIRDFVFVGPAS
jgi:6-phosphogluconolactonase (cycloisomerase 2 family)